MSASMMELKLSAIRYDVGLSRGEKIAKLEHLRNAACALRTAALTNALSLEYGWYEELHLIDEELAGLNGAGHEGATITFR